MRLTYWGNVGSHRKQLCETTWCIVYSCLSSRLASFTNTQSQLHSSFVLLVQSTLMWHSCLLLSFRSSAHDMNTWTAHTVDLFLCVLFLATIGFLAASISSLEIVASKTSLCFLWVWCWQSRELHVSNKVSSGSWERPWALPKLVAKTGTGKRPVTVAR